MGMNVVHSGNTFQIYGDALKTYEQLPVGTYEVCFNKFQGFFLTGHNDLEVNESKVYGCSEKKVQKVLHSFSKVDRNFGVILSGRKGIGKSLFARLLAVNAKEWNLPMLLVTEYYPGIANFLSSIEQEVIVLFDEFDKTFASKDETAPQEELLPLFDGLDGGKKLFVVTCNEIHRLNNYLLNRPGRFHYHFVLTNPTPEEIREYLTDKLDEQYQPLIKKVVSFATHADLTYDILRAIAFELNNGYSFEETLTDLNISKENTPRFDIIVEFEDGSRRISTDCKVDLYSAENDYFWFQCEKKPNDKSMRLDFRPCDVVFDIDHAEITLAPDKVERYIDEDDFNMDDADDKARYEYLRKVPIKKITFVRKMEHPMFKYMV